MSKRAIQKTAEATGNLIGNKIGYKIISAPTLSSKTGNLEFENKNKKKTKTKIESRTERNLSPEQKYNKLLINL